MPSFMGRFLNPDFTVNRDVNIAAAMHLTGNAEKAANKKKRNLKFRFC
ncbi:MAG: hypothetical protein ACXW11_07065 [Methylotenera sp.]